MSTVVVVPCTPVRAAQLAEGRRMLQGQGRIGAAKRKSSTEAVDDAVARVLWIGRALPVVLDVLAQRSLLDTRFLAGDVEIFGVPPPRTPMVLVGYCRDDERLVEVLAMSAADLERRAFDAAWVRVAVPFADTSNSVPGPDSGLESDLDDDITADDNVIRLQRFSFSNRSPGGQ